MVAIAGNLSATEPLPDRLADGRFTAEPTERSLATSFVERRLACRAGPHQPRCAGKESTVIALYVTVAVIMAVGSLYIAW